MNSKRFSVFGNLVDVHRRTIVPKEVVVADGLIVEIRPFGEAVQNFLMPGFLDAHIHVESSMLVPSQFARMAVVHGTVATVSDPHEIANVLGEAGIEFMLDDAARVPLKICFGVPSCVPATEFETAGAAIDSLAVSRLLDDPRLSYLCEMMNYPGVLSGDAEVLAKLQSAKQRDKPIDGHAPGLRGNDAAKYVAAGITTDHECTTLEEAIDKLAAGCQIQIRQGSAARNFDALHALIDDYPEQCMFCSDDKHPDELLVGHINLLVRQAVEQGHELFNVLRCASVNPVRHYGLKVGLLQVGDPADFIEVDSLQEFRVQRTFLDGVLVADKGVALFDVEPPQPVNLFRTVHRNVSEFAVPVEPSADSASVRIRVIEAIDGELTTRSIVHEARVDDGHVIADVESDVLKIVVVNRYADATPAVAFIRNFGLKRGAIACSVAHDCHNIVAVGVTDEHLCTAVNALVDSRGGLAVVDAGEPQVLPLPVAGLMSIETCEEVAASYTELNQMTMRMGATLKSPFMTMSFMALLVIPSLKLSDKGLFDGDRFEFVSLFV